MLAYSLQYLRRGSYGEYVRVVQKVLNDYIRCSLLAASAPLVEDASFGPKTEAAVKLFQSRYGLSPDGIVGPLTRANLFPLGTHQTVCCVTSPTEDYYATAEPGEARLNFLFPGNLLGQTSPQLPPLVPPLVLNWPSSTTFPLAPMPPGSGVLIDNIPGFPDPLPFPDIIPKLPSLQFPTLPPLLPPLPPLTLPPFFPNKVQLAAGGQRAVPSLTLFGPPPKTNPVLDTFPFTLRGLWLLKNGGQFQAGGTAALPISQPISDPKNTTFQVFAQGLTPDLLIAYKSWVHLYLIGKASVTVAKDGSSASAALSPQFKSSFDITKDGSLKFSVTGGPQVAGTVKGGKFTLSLTPAVVNAGFTVSF